MTKLLLLMLLLITLLPSLFDDNGYHHYHRNYHDYYYSYHCVTMLLLGNPLTLNTITPDRFRSKFRPSFPFLDLFTTFLK